MFELLDAKFFLINIKFASNYIFTIVRSYKIKLY